VRSRTGKTAPILIGGLLQAREVDNGAVQIPSSSIDSLICAVLRGEQPAWTWDCGDAAIQQTMARVDFHGVGPLLHGRPVPREWPPQLIDLLWRRALEQTLWELSHQHLLGEALASLHAAGIQPVLFKGTALAYSIYKEPVRARGDTDLIVPPEARESAHRLLSALGWRRAVAVNGEYVSYQSTYTRQAADGARHCLDLHWKINNSEVLSQLFTHGELLRAAQPLPALCPHALGASLVHSLLIACMHRATHLTNPYYVDGVAHCTDMRLIWLADIQLLARQLSDEEWNALVSLARDKGLCAITLDGFARTQERLGMQVPGFVQQALAAASRNEAVSTYLSAGKLTQQWMDFRALKTLDRRLALMRELLFPHPDYMRARFPARSAPLPWLYLLRAFGGAAKRVKFRASPARQMRGPQ